MKWIEVEFEGRTERVPVARAHGRLWIHWRGETYALDLNQGARRSTETTRVSNGVLSAPMPGKVTDVRAKVGDQVAKGQALVVMEAMKMEYTLEADRAGRVTFVNVAPGAQVGLGDVLVKVEA